MSWLAGAFSDTEQAETEPCSSATFLNQGSGTKAQKKPSLYVFIQNAFQQPSRCLSCVLSLSTFNQQLSQAYQGA